MRTAFKLLVWLYVSILVIPVVAQTPAPNTISVFGSAEKNVEPDEIVLSVTLQEYNSDGGKVTINKLEGDLQKAAKEVGIAGNGVVLENVSGFSNYGAEGVADFMISRTYQVRAANFDIINKLLTKIGNQGLTTANVMYFNNAKSKDYMNELKAKALENAKMEAETLLKAAGKKLGSIVSIDVYQDPNTSYYDGYTPYYGAVANPAAGKLAVKPVSLRYSMKVTYLIQ